jgi:hypothetical protein
MPDDIFRGRRLAELESLLKKGRRPGGGLDRVEV